MPRNGSSIMSWPADTEGQPNTPIQSARYNAFLADLLADLNAPRPVTAGGTGASDAAGARANLGLGFPIAVASGGTGGTTPEAARTALGLGAAAVENVVPVAKGGTGGNTAALGRAGLGLGAVATDSVVPVIRGGTGGNTAALGRAGLGLGGLATLGTDDLNYVGDSPNQTNIPVLSIVLVNDATGISRNETMTVRLDAASSDYSAIGAGSVMAGTWKSRGRITSSNTVLAQRVA